jgi:hypothetical protein
VSRGRVAVIVVLSLCALASLVSGVGRGWASVFALLTVVAAIAGWRWWSPRRVPLVAIVALGVTLRPAWIAAIPTAVELGFASSHRFAAQLASGEHGPG